MAYKVNSSRVGTVGEEYNPAEGVNVEALLAGGFIVEVAKSKPSKQETASIQDNKESE
jgi:hypothetical protein